MLKWTNALLLAAIVSTVHPSHGWAEAPPPPATIDDDGMRAWLKAYIKTDGWTLITADDVAVTLGGPDGVAVMEDGTLSVQIRHEYYGPTRLGPMGTRSNLQSWNIDCERQRMRVLSITMFQDNNLSGASQSAGRNDVEWTSFDPDSARGRTVKRVCEAPKTGKRME